VNALVLADQHFVGAAPAGFATVFKGWNVWGVQQKDDLDIEPLMIGVSRDRRLRVWVEEAADAAPGTAVADTANPFALKGSQVELINSVGDLVPAETQAAALPGTALDGPATVRLVRFFNRGAEAVTPWPHDSNYLLDTVYQPATNNPITNAPAPSSLAGTATQVTSDVGSVVKLLAIGGGIVLAIFLVTTLAKTSRKAPAS
jgi:hypothetical protein